MVNTISYLSTLRSCLPPHGTQNCVTNFRAQHLHTDWQVTETLLSFPAYPTQTDMHNSSFTSSSRSSSGTASVPKALLYASKTIQRICSYFGAKALFKGSLSVLLRIPNRTACTPALSPGAHDTFWYYFHQIPETPLENPPEELPQPDIMPVLCSLCSRQVGEIQGCGHYSQRPGHLRTALLSQICCTNYS